MSVFEKVTSTRLLALYTAMAKNPVYGIAFRNSTYLPPTPDHLEARKEESHFALVSIAIAVLNYTENNALKLESQVLKQASNALEQKSNALEQEMETLALLVNQTVAVKRESMIIT